MPKIDLTRGDYRAPTVEERKRFHEAGSCCVIRVWPKGSGPKGSRDEALCPNRREPDGCKCPHHAAMEA